MLNRIRIALRRHSATLLALAFFICPLRADVPLPPNVLNPGSPAEAWNVIRLATSNVGRLIHEGRLPEVAEQISLCSPSLRLLAQAPVGVGGSTKVGELTSAAFRHVNSIAQAGMAQSGKDAERFFADLQSVLRDMGAHFDPSIVAAEIYQCRAHSDVVSVESGARCRKCNEPLVVRRIPYSFIYVLPGEAGVKLAASSAAPLAAGKKADVLLTIQTVKGAPVNPADLLVIHSKPVHAMMVDESFGDFHSAQPTPTEKPGEYAFSFEPAGAGPYRIWADVVPVTTGLEELPHADLGGAYTPKPAADKSGSLVSTGGGFHFQLASGRGNGSEITARQIQFLRLNVTDSAGQPVTRLEPFLNAFAHVTGLYDDGKTVLRLHPTGGDVLREEVRGGPMLGFKIYPPRAGFIRFYCQVRIDGRTITVPFGVNVAE